ncbi:MAG: hypothetical protein AAGI03_04460 [Pseudomonadota bacterium]
MTPSEFLDRFFDVIREEAETNPAFAARLVKAAGAEVSFEVEDKAAILNPLEVAAEAGSDGVRQAFDSFDSAALKDVLVQHNLASRSDMRSRGKSDLLDMLADRATSRVTSRSSVATPKPKPTID